MATTTTTMTTSQGSTAGTMPSHSKDSDLASYSFRTIQNQAGYVLPHLKPDFHILDAGCGPGTISSSLAALVPEGRVVGIDAEEKSIKTASEQANLPRNCTFQVGNLTHRLPFDDNEFDLIHTSQVLCHIPQSVEVMKEFHRVLKVGGLVACREHDGPALMMSPMNHGLEIYHRCMIATVEGNGGHPTAGRLLPRWALDAGFTDIVDYTVGSLTYTGEKTKFFGPVEAKRVMEDKERQATAQKYGALKDGETFEMIRDGLLAWVEDPAAVFAMPCGQIVARK